MGRLNPGAAKADEPFAILYCCGKCGGVRFTGQKPAGPLGPQDHVECCTCGTVSTIEVAEGLRLRAGATGKR